MATFAERTDKLFDILTAGAADLADGLTPTGAAVGVYLGIGRPVPDQYSLFAVRWNDPQLALMQFRGGLVQDGISDYKLIVQVKCLGGAAAANASIALDTIGENLCGLLQANAGLQGYWHNGQIIRSTADVRPNISAPYTDVAAAEYWQTETWTFRVEYRVTRT